MAKGNGKKVHQVTKCYKNSHCVITELSWVYRTVSNPSYSNFQESESAINVRQLNELFFSLKLKRG